MVEIFPIPTDPRFQDLTGRVYGRLTVIGYAGQHGKTRTSYWRCRCTCGTIKKVSSSALKRGETASCGCLQRELVAKHRTTHGRSDTREHRIWQAMLSRCTNENHPRYKDYGGRGVKVCERWRHSFANFFADMGEAPSAMHTLDRKENDGDYSPENCRWATYQQQRRNARESHLHLIEYRSETRCLTEWAELFGLTRDILRGRLRKGWPIHDALTVPVKKG